MTTVLDAAPETPEVSDRPAPAVTARVLRRQLAAAARVLIVLTVLLGVVYPAVVWGVSRLPGLHANAEGSVLPGSVPGSSSAPLRLPTGSSLIGVDPVPANPAADPWFHTRPSASAQAADGLGPADPTTSGGTNRAMDNPDQLAAVDARRAAIAAREGVAPATVPPDAVTASGSGLDPAISPAYAALQVPRVARVTGLPVAQVRALVATATHGRSLGVLGEPTVNVGELNAALHAAAPQAR